MGPRWRRGLGGAGEAVEDGPIQIYLCRAMDERRQKDESSPAGGRDSIFLCYRTGFHRCLMNPPV